MKILEFLGIQPSFMVGKPIYDWFDLRLGKIWMLKLY